MKFTSESKFFIGVFVATLAIVGVAVMIFSKPTIIAPVEISIPQSAHIAGNPSASTTLIEFSDFQCPACETFEPIVQEVVKKYGDRIRFIYLHFPLSKHAMAEPSARAAESAGMQGKFWEMHHLLFENQLTLSEETITRLAQSLNLNMQTFQSDYTSLDIKNRVEQDRLEGMRLGIPGTPTFYLNGKKLTLYSPKDLELAIQDVIEK